jgi:hypothetical protein
VNWETVNYWKKPDKRKTVLDFKNGKLITTVEGLDFKAALFGIWIIDKPSHKNEKLRTGMLGM